MKITFDLGQLRAIEHERGPMLVWAGAGTGKTTVLVERAARLARENIAQPGEILAIAYAESAADEIRRRVLRHSGDAIATATFHGYCFGLLARAQQTFQVLDDADLWIYLRQHVDELPLRNFIKAADLGAFLRDLTDFFRRCHDELITPQDYFGYLARVENGELPLPRVAKSSASDSLARAQVLERCREIGATFAQVEKMLRESNFGTFGHMITNAVRLLESDAALLARERQRARFLLIDEFQDANYGQVRLARLLAGDEQNVFAVGDPDQAIFRFRGASTAAFEQFVTFFPDAKLVRMERNHRSLEPILACAHAVVANNPQTMRSPDETAFRRRPLISARQEQAAEEGRKLNAAPVLVAGANPRLAEACAVGEVIETLRRRERSSWRDFAVLYRSHWHRDEILDELAGRGIPAAVAGVNILESPEFRDLLACLRWMHSPADAIAMLRVAALPKFALAGEDLRTLLRQKTGLEEKLGATCWGEPLIAAIQEARLLAARGGMQAAAAFDAASATFGFDDQNPIIRRFRKFVADWETKSLAGNKTLTEFLGYLDLYLQTGAAIEISLGAEDAVQLMTVHVAKGLEFRHVFVLRATSQSFPSNYQEVLFEFPAALRPADSMAQSDNSEIHKQEERRLFYVAMTRARDTLSLYGKPGRSQKDPSPPGFLRELLHASTAKGFWRQQTIPDPLFDLRGSAEPMPVLAAWLYAPLPPASEPILSASALDSYQRCPLRFKLEREWALPAKPSDALQFGDAMHKALRIFGERARAGEATSFETLYAAFRNNFSTAHLEPLERTLYEARARRQLQAFVTAHAEALPAVLSAERGFEHEIGGVRIRGRLDRLDRISRNCASENRKSESDVALIDYKTGAPRSQEDADKSLQLSLYAIAIEEKFELMPARLVFYNLETGAEVATTRTPQQLAEAKAQVSALAQAIAAGIFTANPNHQCRSCPYREICPTQEKILHAIQPAVAAAVGKVN